MQNARSKIKNIPNSELFTINNFDRKYIKNKIIKNNLIEYKCSVCQITHWNNTPLSLHLDHINGINNDNRLENLRFLCPNCHSLTNTYCGKNKEKIYIKEENVCKDCFCKITSSATFCAKCIKCHKTKINWPEDNELIIMVKSQGYSATGKLLHVSGNAIKKRLHSKGLLIN